MDGKLQERLGALIQSTIVNICKHVLPSSEEFIVENNLTITKSQQTFCSLSFRQSSLDPVSCNTHPLEAESPVCPSRLSDHGENGKLLNTSKSEQNDHFKTPSPQVGSLANMGKLTGSRQCLVDTLVAEAMKIWYDEGSSPERLQQLRQEYANNSHKSATVELSIEAMREYGEISPETLEAAAQLRRLREQPPLLLTPSATQLPPPQCDFSPTPETKPKHVRKQDITVNNSCDTPNKVLCNDEVEFQTPVKNDKDMYQCSSCSKEFTFATNLTRHQRNFHGRPYSRKTKTHKSDKDSDEALEDSSDVKLVKNFGKEFEVMDGPESEGQMNPTEVHPKVALDQTEIAQVDILAHEHDEVSDGNNSGSTSEDTSDGCHGDINASHYKYVNITKDPVCKFSCRICGRKFQHYRNLGRHLKVAHSMTAVEVAMSSRNSEDGTTGPHVCKLCGLHFSFSSNLYRHMTKVHKTTRRNPAQKETEPDKGVSGKAVLNCDLCSAVFTVSSNLARHIKQVHRMKRVPLTPNKHKKPPANEKRAEINVQLSQPITGVETSAENNQLQTPQITDSSPTNDSGESTNVVAIYVSALTSDTAPINNSTPISNSTPIITNSVPISDSAPIVTNPAPAPIATNSVPIPDPTPFSNSTLLQYQPVYSTSLTPQSYTSPLLRTPSYPHNLLATPTRQQAAPLGNPTLIHSPSHECPTTPVAVLPPTLPSSPLLLPQFPTPDLFGVSSFPPQHNIHPLHNIHTPIHAPTTVSTYQPQTQDISPQSDSTVHISPTSDTTPPNNPEYPSYNPSETLLLSPQVLPHQSQFSTNTQQNNTPTYNQALQPVGNDLQQNRRCGRSVARENAGGHRYKCPVCSQRFTLRTNLVRHVKHVHRLASPPSQSDVDDKANLSSQSKTSIRPAPSVPLKIPIIPLATRTSNRISPESKKPKRSERKKTEDNNTSSVSRHRHVCPVCANSFTFRTNLTRHLRIQHKQSPLDDVNTRDS